MSLQDSIAQTTGYIFVSVENYHTRVTYLFVHLDLSHSDTRLSVMLNGFELHVYNRSDVYSQLERVFGLDPLIIPNSESKGGEF